MISSIFQLTQIFLILSIVVQTLEYFSLRKKLWIWNIEEKSFLMLLTVRLFCSLILIFSFSFIALILLFFSTLLISWRFRGSFNGGSDFMTTIVLSALCVGSLHPTEKMLTGVLFYIAFQSAASYFLAGLVKIKKREWRKGEALSNFIHSPNYNPPLFVKNLLSDKKMALLAAWAVMLGELLFPLVLLCGNKTAVMAVLTGAFLFHLNNVLLFGLNRFLLAWLTTYPAIYFTAIYFATNKFSNSP